MHLRDLKLRAMDGSVLVDGDLAIVGDEPAAALLPSSRGRLVGVDLGHGGRRAASFNLYERTTRAGDGFYAAPPPILTVRLERSLPDVSDFFPRAATRRQWLQGENAHLATVSAQLAGGGATQGQISGHIQDLTITTQPDDAGLRLGLTGSIGPMRVHGEATPRIAHARLVAHLLVPGPYCEIRGVSSGWKRPPYRQQGEWRPWGPGLGSAPVGHFGRPLCPGRLTWGAPRGGPPTPTGHVALHLDEHRLVARPVGALDLLDGGFAAPRESWTDGPELELAMGTAEWARMLADRDEAELELRGAGIGHVDGQTGRSVGECGGPMRQLLTELRVHLRRSAEGLHVRGQGTLSPLAGDPGRSLGPEVAFEHLLPRGWILARGLDLPRFWQDWRRDFPDETAW